MISLLKCGGLDQILDQILDRNLNRNLDRNLGRVLDPERKAKWRGAGLLTRVARGSKPPGSSTDH
jgi:hypothetical protein